MLTLAIDTTSSITSIVLLDGNKVLDERNWKSEQNEAEKLMPAIVEMVPKLSDIGKIIAVRGPGSFTGLRVGVTVANTLAYLLDAELYGVDTFAVWNERCNKDAVLLIKAGRNEIFMNEEIIGFDNLDLEGKTAFGDLMPGQEEKLKALGVHFVPDSKIKSFGEAIANLEGLKKVKIIKPEYRRAPSITKSKNKWKNPK